MVTKAPICSKCCCTHATKVQFHGSLFIYFCCTLLCLRYTLIYLRYTLIYLRYTLLCLRYTLLWLCFSGCCILFLGWLIIVVITWSLSSSLLVWWPCRFVKTAPFSRVLNSSADFVAGSKKVRLGLALIRYLCQQPHK